MKKRNRAQIMGYWLNEPGILDTNLVKSAMEDLAREGFGIVRIMLRNTNFHHRSPLVVEAIRVAVETGHAHGMRVALDSEPHRDPVTRDMGREFPDATGIRLVRARTKIVNGTFHLRMVVPHTDAQMGIFDGVESAFIRRRDGMQKIDSLPFQLTWENASYTNDRCDEQSYEFGRPVHNHRVGKLNGKLDEPEGTELIAYVRIRDVGIVDFWAEGFRKYFDMLLEAYQGIPIDGMGWDEPTVGGDWHSYRYGNAFAKTFEKAKGYRLADRLWLLDEHGASPAAVQVRLDYYHHLNEGVAVAQENMIAKAKSLFGEDILLGTHHTWQGEGGINDYRAGAVDYFRLTDSMDAGYTDCCWWDMDSVCYAYALGSSLGRLTESGEIECNTWHFKPTNLQIQYNVRLMTLLDITWFNIWYGSDSDTCQYPTHYTWAESNKAMRLHHRYQTRLAGLKPVTEIAIWHGWEGVTAINQPSVAGAQKTFCMNIARLFIEKNVPFDFVDSRILEKGEVIDGELATVLSRYRIIVLPYAAVLPRAAWDRVLEFARQGGKLVFVGPPPEMDTAGKSLGEEFAELLKMPRLRLNDYLSHLYLTHALSDGRPPRLDVHYPLKVDETRLLTSVEDEPHGVKNPEGNIVYLTDLDPRNRLKDLLATWTKPEVVCLGENIQWRLYRGKDHSIIVCIARKEQQLHGIIRYAGQEIEIRRGTLAYIQEKNGKIEVQGEGLDVIVRPQTN